MGTRDLASQPDPPEDPCSRKSEQPSGASPTGSTVAKTLFAGVLLVYLITRFIGLGDYPIYFFCDEAVQTTLASEFVRDGLRNEQGELFPTFFRNYDMFNLGPSVYAQVIPALVLPRSIVVTRATAMLFTLLAVMWVSLILKDIFSVEHWWLGGLLLSMAPAWFLHSRTAFETTMMASFYAGFLYEYLRYRNGDVKRLPVALVLGALAFYTYSPGRVIVAVTGLAFLIADHRYHLRHRREAAMGAGLLALLTLPLVRFLIAHPTANHEQLAALGSYWLRPLPLTEKLANFGAVYLSGLDPFYWFLPNDADLTRHVMGPYPHILTWLLPLFVIGLIVAVASARRPPHRLLLLALLAAPTGAAIVSLGITRALVFLIPATLVTALGLDLVIRQLSRWPFFRTPWLAVGLFAAGVTVNATLLADALTRGPTWDENYTMGGMQWGAEQLYTAVGEWLDDNPEQEILISPDWANGADELAWFFFPDEIPFRLGTARVLAQTIEPEIDMLLVITIPDELRDLRTSGKFSEIEILRTISYPNGEPGFYFLRLAYRDTIEEILQAEIDARHRLRESRVTAWGNSLIVRYPELDMGPVDKIFDGDPGSLARTSEANPMVLELELEHPMTATGLWLGIGSSLVSVDLQLYPPGSPTPVSFDAEGQGSLGDPRVFVDLESPRSFDRIRLELNDLRWQEPANVHLWEMTFVDEP